MANVDPRFTTVLFYGPSGCGKTLLANAWFGEFQSNDSSWISTKMVASQILLEPFAKIMELFATIKRYSVRALLIEDYDDLMNHLGSTPAAHKLLLDYIKDASGNHMVIATARHPEKLTTGELGVFQNVFPVLYPDEKERLDILNIYTRKVQLDSSVNLENIAKSTSWWAGSELHDLISQSTLPDNFVTLDELQKHLNEMQSRIKTESRVDRMRELLMFTKTHCNDKVISDDALLRHASVIASPAPTTTEIAQITNVSLRTEVERAVKNLTLDNVDMGLFQLAKILENEITNYLTVVKAKGAVVISNNDMFSLANKMNTVARIGIVQKKHHLELLREHRNERAHGQVPDKAKRERLLIHAPFLRDLFVEYILLFNREAQKL